MFSLAETLDRTIKQLERVYTLSSECEQIAWWLIEGATKRTRVQLLANPVITNSSWSKVENWLDEHILEDKPLQYILGTVPFYDLTIHVKPPTLIPRPETEEWCVKLINELQPVANEPLQILDLCTGSGCIAMLLAKHLPESHVTAIDIVDEALDLARKNAKHNKIKNVTWLHSDIFSKIPETQYFDIIVSNPPYISESKWHELDQSVKKWEDHRALLAHDEGLGIVNKIITEAQNKLRQNKRFEEFGIPQLVIEIGYDQGGAVAQMLDIGGYKQVTINHDLAGRYRTVSARI